MGNLCCCVVIPHSTRGLVDSCTMTEPRVLTPGVHCVCWPRGEGLVGSVSCVPRFADVCSEARTQDGIDMIFNTKIEFRVHTHPSERVISAYENFGFLDDKFQLETERAIRDYVGTLGFGAIRARNLDQHTRDHLRNALANWGYDVITCGVAFRRRD